MRCAALLVCLGLIAQASPTDVRGAEPPTAPETLPGTRVWQPAPDMAAETVAGVGRYLQRALDGSIARRAERWQRDDSSPEAYARSVEPNRRSLSRMIGLRDERARFDSLRFVGLASPPQPAGRGAGFEAWLVTWPALHGVQGEGLLLEPIGRPPMAQVVALGDCEHTPEMLAGLAPGAPEESQFARRLAERGCRVLVPTLVDRQMDLSVIAAGTRKGTVTHRELLYRGAYQMGRHLIGYEVQKALAGVDWLEQRGDAPLAVVGYGEGALIALFAAALDQRIAVAGISGYFDSRQEVWREPIDRNVCGFLSEFGDAEIGSLIAPRALVVEACRGPQGSIAPGGGSAPARLESPPLSRVEEELARCRTLVGGLRPSPPQDFIVSGAGEGPFGTTAFLDRVLEHCGQAEKIVRGNSAAPKAAAAPHSPPPGAELALPELTVEPDWLERHMADRRARQLREILDFNERLIDESGAVRREALKSLEIGRDLDRYRASALPHRQEFHERIIGRIADDSVPADPRSRLRGDSSDMLAYDVVLDVLPDVILYGILLQPRDIAPGERRPVVVCQHGLEGRAEHTVAGDRTSYRDFAARLAERGFVTFSPQHLYVGGDSFRTLQRQANPLGLSLFSVMIAQHRQLLAWLAELDFVDPRRIAFYGISYGGKSAMRIPAVLEGYCLSICSSDFSDWIWRTVSHRHGSGYLAHSEYEMFEFDLGTRFNYAEMAALIAPRPFMVERFHDNDAFAERMLMEFAKVRLLYESLGVPDRLEMTYYAHFQTPSRYVERATFDFLHERLRWPARATPP